MPAVELNRLKKQADELAACLHQPAEFKRLLSDRLEYYADRVTRPGNKVRPAPLIPRYGVPALFLQTVEHALQQPASNSPAEALELAKELWKDSHLEPKLIAASLIGMAARSDPGDASELLLQYCVPKENPLVQEALLQRSGSQLRQANIDVWFDLVERWINSGQLSQQIIGFRALHDVIEDREFENLPVIYRLLTVPLESVDRTTMHELEPLITTLIRRSPVETSYLLRQCFNRTHNPILARLIRKCLPLFPPEGQSTLRKVIQEQEASG